MLEMLQSLSRMLQARRTPAERTAAPHTHLGAPTSPLLGHNCGFWRAKPKLLQGRAGREPRQRRSPQSPQRLARLPWKRGQRSEISEKQILEAQPA